MFCKRSHGMVIKRTKVDGGRYIWKGIRENFIYGEQMVLKEFPSFSHIPFG